MSGHRVLGNPSTTFYSATKFAVTALTEGLRKELRDQKSNIKITVSFKSLCIQYKIYKLLFPVGYITWSCCY